MIINKLMMGGKKATAERIMYGALQEIGERTGQNPVDVLTQALRNVTPAVEVRPRRVGGATYQVPVEVNPLRQMTLAVRWLVRAARERPERTMRQRLASELIDAANREGATFKRREDTQRMADANKAYAHYRW
jgi:small subunit ribosomal protein S7